MYSIEHVCRIRILAKSVILDKAGGVFKLRVTQFVEQI